MKEKLITMNERCWHYKLIKFVWNFEPKEFKNLCPYFWLTIASIFVVPFTCIWKCIEICWIKFFKVLDYLSSKFINWLDSVEYSNKLVRISPVDVYYLKHMNDEDNSSIGWADSLIHFTLLRNYFSRHPNLLDDVKIEECKEDEFATQLDKMFEHHRLLRQKELKKEESKEEAKRRIKKRMNKIAEITRSISVVIFSLCLVAIVFLLTAILTDIFIWLLHFTVDWNEVLKGLLLFLFMGLIVTITTFSFIYLIDYGEKWMNEENKGFLKKIFVYMYYPIHIIVVKVIFEYIIINFICKFLGYTIIWGIIKGIGVGLDEFGGIFSDYFNASYSDYCPGINWEE